MVTLLAHGCPQLQSPDVEESTGKAQYCAYDSDCVTAAPVPRMGTPLGQSDERFTLHRVGFTLSGLLQRGDGSKGSGL
jgi:hypothetical protein